VSIPMPSSSKHRPELVTELLEKLKINTRIPLAKKLCCLYTGRVGANPNTSFLVCTSQLARSFQTGLQTHNCYSSFVCIVA
jgi:hypothetical protein